MVSIRVVYGERDAVKDSVADYIVVRNDFHFNLTLLASLPYSPNDEKEEQDEEVMDGSEEEEEEEDSGFRIRLSGDSWPKLVNEIRTPNLRDWQSPFGAFAKIGSPSLRLVASQINRTPGLQAFLAVIELADAIGLGANIEQSDWLIFNSSARQYLQFLIKKQAVHSLRSESTLFFPSEDVLQSVNHEVLIELVAQSRLFQLHFESELAPTLTTFFVPYRFPISPTRPLKPDADRFWKTILELRNRAVHG